MSDLVLSSPHFDRVGRIDWWLPRGALVVASELNRYNSFKTKIIDLDLLGENDEERILRLKERIKEEKPERIFLSVHGLFAVARFAYLLNIPEIRKEHPGIKFIAGGPLACVEPNYILRFLDVDHVVRGQIDLSTTGVLIDKLQRGKNKIIDLIPFQLSDYVYYLDFELYTDLLSQAKREVKSGTINIYLETVRSCPYSCTFCSIPPQYPYLPRGRVSTREITSIKAELEFLSSLGEQSIGISDPTFGTDWSHTALVMYHLHRLGFAWNVMSRSNVLTAKKLKRMKRAGCTSIALGIETPSKDILEAIHKHTTAELNAEALRLIRNAGIDPIALVILGLSREDDFPQLTNYLYRNKVQQVVTTVYHPTPGSSSFAGDMKHARIESVRDLEDFDFLGPAVLDWQDSEKLEAQRLALRIAYKNPYDPIYVPEEEPKKVLAKTPDRFEYFWLENALFLRIGRQIYYCVPPSEYGEFTPVKLIDEGENICFAKKEMNALRLPQERKTAYATLAKNFNPVQKKAADIRKELLSEGKTQEFFKRLRTRANQESPAVRKLLLSLKK